MAEKKNSDAPAEDGKKTGGKESFRVLTPVRFGKRTYVAGENIAGLGPEQAAELLTLGVIEKA